MGTVRENRRLAENRNREDFRARQRLQSAARRALLCSLRLSRCFWSSSFSHAHITGRGEHCEKKRCRKRPLSPRKPPQILRSTARPADGFVSTTLCPRRWRRFRKARPQPREKAGEAASKKRGTWLRPRATQLPANAARLRSSCRSFYYIRMGVAVFVPALVSFPAAT